TRLVAGVDLRVHPAELHALDEIVAPGVEQTFARRRDVTAVADEPGAELGVPVALRRAVPCPRVQLGDLAAPVRLPVHGQRPVPFGPDGAQRQITGVAPPLLSGRGVPAEDRKSVV